MSTVEYTADWINAVDPTLREVVTALCAIERPPGSPGEAQAARWLAERLRLAGCDARIEEAGFHDGYANVIGPLAALGALGGMLSGRRRTRKLGGALALAATALMADDISNGWRPVRRALGSRPTQNVVAVCGDIDAQRTLVVLAHHDAAHTGFIFDDRVQQWLGARFPGLVERIDTALPIWWPPLAGPAAIAAASLAPADSAVARALRRLGTLTGVVSALAFADIARSPIAPGANDNASAIAVQVALAERLAAEPVTGLRVLLVSCGAEEVVQGGINSFARDHFPELDKHHTWFLVLDTVGSPKLALLEGEGPIVMEDYCDRGFRDLVGRVADRAGAPVRRGLRARNSTDAVIPSRAGYPTATFTSVDRHKALSNYHTMEDTPENLDYRTVAHATLVADAVVRELATNPWIGGC